MKGVVDIELKKEHGDSIHILCCVARHERKLIYMPDDLLVVVILYWYSRTCKLVNGIGPRTQYMRVVRPGDGVGTTDKVPLTFSLHDIAKGIANIARIKL